MDDVDSGAANRDAVRTDDDVVRSPVAAGSPAEVPPTGNPVVARWKHPVAAAALTTLASLFVVFGLIAPNQFGSLTLEAFARIPLEGLLGITVALLVPTRARQILAGLAGALLGVLTILRFVDMGFYATLDRPFDIVLDWVFLTDGMEFLQTSFGHARALGIEIGIVVLALGIVVFMTLAVLRLTRLAARHRTPAIGTVSVLGLVWVTCAVFGVQFVPGTPVAASSAAALTVDNVHQVQADLHDKQDFAKAAAIDPFRNTPSDQLLTGLRGKDVILAFVESYGRSAIEDPKLSPQVDAALAAGSRRLSAAGFAAKSGFLTSPTAGGGSFLAHSTLLSGVWINNKQRYDALVDSNRQTLTSAFQRANWRTVAVVPDTTRAWPEGKFFGYDKVYAAHDFGYKGPAFAWAVLPDQYALSVFQKTERANPNHAPVMAEMALVSSHAPWAPVPSMVDWDALGDGSIFTAQKQAQDPPGVVWRDPDRVRAQYSQSIAYTLTSLTSYLQKYGDKNTVLIFLGDHQPASIVVGEGAIRQVPITIVAKDPAVLDRISSWGWTDGLKPSPKAPVWAMDSFRNRFLTAFGPQNQPTDTAP